MSAGGQGPARPRLHCTRGAACSTLRGMPVELARDARRRSRSEPACARAPTPRNHQPPRWPLHGEQEPENSAITGARVNMCDDGPFIRRGAACLPACAWTGCFHPEAHMPCTRVGEGRARRRHRGVAERRLGSPAAPQPRHPSQTRPWAPQQGQVGRSTGSRPTSPLERCSRLGRLGGNGRIHPLLGLLVRPVRQAALWPGVQAKVQNHGGGAKGEVPGPWRGRA